MKQESRAYRMLCRLYRFVLRKMRVHEWMLEHAAGFFARPPRRAMIETLEPRVLLDAVSFDYISSNLSGLTIDSANDQINIDGILLGITDGSTADLTWAQEGEKGWHYELEIGGAFNLPQFGLLNQQLNFSLEWYEGFNACYVWLNEYDSGEITTYDDLDFPTATLTQTIGPYTATALSSWSSSIDTEITWELRNTTFISPGISSSLALYSTAGVGYEAKTAGTLSMSVFEDLGYSQALTSYVSWDSDGDGYTDGNWRPGEGNGFSVSISAGGSFEAWHEVEASPGTQQAENDVTLEVTFDPTSGSLFGSGDSLVIPSDAEFEMDTALLDPLLIASAGDPDDPGDYDWRFENVKINATQGENGVNTTTTAMLLDSTDLSSDTGTAIEFTKESTAGPLGLKFLGGRNDQSLKFGEKFADVGGATFTSDQSSDSLNWDPLMTLGAEGWKLPWQLTGLESRNNESANDSNDKVTKVDGSYSDMLRFNLGTVEISAQDGVVLPDGMQTSASVAGTWNMKLFNIGRIVQVSNIEVTYVSDSDWNFTGTISFADLGGATYALSPVTFDWEDKDNTNIRLNDQTINLSSVALGQGFFLSSLNLTVTPGVKYEDQNATLETPDTPRIGGTPLSSADLDVAVTIDGSGASFDISGYNDDPDFGLYGVGIDIDAATLVSDADESNNTGPINSGGSLSERDPYILPENWWEPKLSVTEGEARLDVVLPLGFGDVSIAKIDLGSTQIHITPDGFDASGEYNIKQANQDYSTGVFDVPIHVEVSDTAVAFDTTYSMVKLQAKIAFPEWDDATLDLTGDNYIKITDSGIVMVGEFVCPGPISFSDDPKASGDWGLYNLKLTFDTETNKYSGSVDIGGEEGTKKTLSIQVMAHKDAEGSTSDVNTAYARIEYTDADDEVDLTLFGVKVKVAKLVLVTDQNVTQGDYFDPMVMFGGTVILPEELTGISQEITGTIGIADNEMVKISSAGVEFPSGTIGLSGVVEWKLFNIVDVIVESPSLEYVKGDGDIFRFRGKVTFPQFKDMTFDFTSDGNVDRYVQLSESADGPLVEMVGTIDLAQDPDRIEIWGEKWSVYNIIINVDTKNHEYKGTADFRLNGKLVKSKLTLSPTVFTFTLTSRFTFDLAGTKVNISKLGFTSDRDPGQGEDWDPELEISGKITLPDEWGGLEIAVNNGNKLLINSEGFAITGAGIKLPNQTINIGGIFEVTTKNVHLTFDFGDQVDTATLLGEFTIPTLNDLSINLSKPHGFSVRQRAEDDSIQFAMNVEAALDSIPIWEEWHLEDVNVIANKDWDTSWANARVEGSAKVIAPSGHVDVSFEYNNGRIQEIETTIGEPLGFTFFGTTAEITYLNLILDRDTSNDDDWEPELKLCGKLILPEALGSAEVTLEKAQEEFVVINGDGIGLTGGRIDVPDIDANFLGIVQIQGSNMSLEYETRSGVKQLTIRGTLVFPTLWEATIDFGSSDSKYIKLTENGDVDLVGELSLGEVAIVPGVWELQEFVLEIDTPNSMLKGKAKMLLPTGHALEGELSFLNGELNSVAIGVDNLGLPILSTGAYLQRLYGAVNHIASSDEESLDVTAEIGMTYGPEVNFSIPFYGDFSGSLIEMAVSGSVNACRIKVDGSLIVVSDAVAKGSGDVEVNWDRGYIKANSSINILSGLLTITTMLDADSDSLKFGGRGTVTVPDFIPVLGGEELADGGVYFESTNSSKYVMAWGEIWIPFWGTEVAGIKLDMKNDSWDFIGAETVDSVDFSSSSMMYSSSLSLTESLYGTTLSTSSPNGALYLPSSGSENGTFTVTGPLTLSSLNVTEIEHDFLTSGIDETALSGFLAYWDNDVSGVTLELTDPDNNTYTESMMGTTGCEWLEILDTGSTNSRMIVVDPSGLSDNTSTTDKWTLRVIHETESLVNLNMRVFESREVALLDVDLGTPTFNETTQTVSVSISNETNFDNGNTVSADDLTFYYDTDGAGYDGEVINGAYDEATQTFTWDVSETPDGEYYIYVMPMDATNAQAVPDPDGDFYASSSVVVDLHDPALEAGWASWVGQTLDSINFHFDEPVTVSSVTDLTITNVATQQTIDISGATIIGNGTETIRWDVGGLSLSDGEYEITLTGANVQDTAGNAIAGNHVFTICFLNTVTDLDADDVTGTDVTLNWTDSSGTATHTVIERVVDGPTVVDVAEVTSAEPEELVTVSGVWTDEIGAAGYNGGGFKLAETPSANTYVEYQVPSSLVFDQGDTHGNVKISIRCTPLEDSSLLATNVPLTITLAGGAQTATVTLDQENNAGEWVELSGVFDLDGNSIVTIGTDGANGYVIADAIKLTSVDGGGDVLTDEGGLALDDAVATIDSEGVVSGVDVSGNWTEVSGYNGETYQVNNNSSAGDYVKYYVPSSLYLDESTSVDVYMKYNATTHDSVSITIQPADGATPITVQLDQTSAAGEWVLLGNFDLDQDSYVQINSDGTGDSIIAGTVRFESLSSVSKVAEASVDSENSDLVTLTGDWEQGDTSGYAADDYEGGGYFLLADNQAGSATFAIPDTIILSDADYVNVFIKNICDSSLNDSVQVNIRTAGGTIQTLTLDLTDTNNSGQWVSLGSFNFDEASYVEIVGTSATGDGAIVVDAVHFEAFRRPWEEIATVEIDSQTGTSEFVDSDTEFGETYLYRVRPELWYDDDNTAGDGSDGVVDGQAAWSNTVSVTISVDAIDDIITTGEDTALTISVANDLLGGLGGDKVLNGALTVTGFTAPAHGTLFDNGDGTYTYTPAADFSGTDEFEYSVSDGVGGKDTAKVTITVEPVNDAPVASADAYEAQAGQTLTVNWNQGVLENDTDIDDERLSAEVVVGQEPAHGTLDLLADGSFTYVPDDGYTGGDSFTYTVSDEDGASSTATVSITVQSVTVAPATVSDLSAGMVTDGSVVLTWTASGDDGAVGMAHHYEVRYLADTPITDQNWDAASAAIGEPLPQIGGSTETMTVSDLDPNTTYYFAIRAVDNAGNISDVSNSPTTSTADDQSAPAGIIDLTTSLITDKSVALTWTAPGDDADAGSAASYEIRYSTSAIVDETTWDAATVVEHTLESVVAGTEQQWTITDLSTAITYYFAVRAVDNVGNMGSLSNIPTATTLADTTAPSDIIDLAVSNLTDESAELTWTAPGDDGASGTVTAYEIRYSQTAITNQTEWDAATSVTHELVPAEYGTTESLTISDLPSATTLYFAIKAIDNAGLESGLSNVVSGSTLADTTLPDPIENLHSIGKTSTTLTLSWDATGDDNQTGTASAYEIRYSQMPITDETEWNAATPVPVEDLPTPSEFGESDDVLIEGLDVFTTYYIAVRAVDNAGNLSDLHDSFATQTAPGDTPPEALDAIFNIDENSANGSQVGAVVATDDFHEVLTYAITAGNESGAFAIDSATGEITVADMTQLDYETTSSYSLTVEVTDDATPTKSDTATITINVNDINDAPVIETNTGANVDEGGAVVITTAMLQTTDVDIDDTTGDLVYTLTAEPAHGALELYNGSTWVELDLATNNTFTQADIDAGNLRYVHDGGEMASDDIADLPSLIYRSGLDGTTLPAGWTAITSGSSTVTLTEDAAQLGETGLNIDRDASGSGAARMSQSIGLDAGETFYLGYWMRINDVVSAGTSYLYINHTMVDGTSTDSRSCTQIYANGQMKYFLGGASGLQLAGTTTWDEDWHHYVHEYQRAEDSNSEGIYRVYCDGVLVAELASSNYAYLNFETWQFNFGRMLETNACSINMDVDEVRIGSSMADVLSPDSFNFTVSDGDVTLNEANFAITANPVNDAPVLSANTGANVDEGGAVVITTAMLQTTDVDIDDTTGDLVYILTAEPAHGALELYNGSTWVQLDLTTNNTFTQANIDAGNLRYVHDGGEVTSDNIADLTGLLQRYSFESGTTSGVTITTTGSSTVTYDAAAAKLGEAGLHISKAAGGEAYARCSLGDSTPQFISFWMKLEDPSDWQAIGAGNGVGLYAYSYYFQVYYKEAGNQKSMTIYADMDEWNHVVLDMETGSHLRVYLNGQLAAEDISEDIETWVTRTSMEFGKTSTSGSYEMYVDEVRYGETLADVLSPDSFNFTVSDGDVTLDEANFAITANPVNDTPEIEVNAGANVDEGDSVIITAAMLQTTDMDIDDTTGDLVYTLTALPANGTLQLNGTDLDLTTNNTFTQADIDNNLLTYTHDGSETPLSDNFSFTVTDGDVTLTEATFAITVTPVNDAPVAVDDDNMSLNMWEYETLSISSSTLLSNDTDSENDTLFISSIDDTGLVGSLTPDGLGGYIYDPGNAFLTLQESEMDYETFSYTVSDGNGGTDTGLVTITLHGFDTAPVFMSTPITTATEDSPYSYSISATDIDSANISFLTYEIPSWLTLTDNGDGTATLSGTPSNSDVGSSSWVVLVARGTGGSETYQDFIINVSNVNDAPVITANAGANVDEGGTVTITTAMLETTDVDINDATGDLVYTVTALPTNGLLKLDGVTLTLNDTFTQADINAALLTYEHDGSETASDSFNFTVTDGDVTLTETTFSLTINPINDAPTVTIDDVPTGDVYEGDSITLNSTITDPDLGDTHTYAWTVLKDGAAYDLTGVATDQATFTFTPDDNATYAVNLTVTDSGTLTDSDTVSITVNNAAPGETYGAVFENALDYNLPMTEGSEIFLWFGFSDAGALDGLDAEIDWGEGGGYETPDSFYESSGWADVSATHTFADSGTHTVNVKVMDDDGGETVIPVTVEILDVAPELYAASSASVDEGSTYTLQLSAINDPGDDTIVQWDIDWGDGGTSTGTTADWGSDITLNVDGTWTATHTYADGKNTYVIEAVATDEESNSYMAVLTDVSFGNIGQKYDATSAGGYPEILRVQSNGKSLFLNDNGNLFRLNADGSVDTSFGNNGELSLSFDGNPGAIRDIQVLSDDSILVISEDYIVSSVTYDFGLLYLDANGAKVTSFGTNGEFYGNFAAGNNSVRRSVVDGDTLLIYGGCSGDLAMAAIDLSNGQLDSTFGSNGVLIVSSGGRDIVFEAGVSVTCYSGTLIRYLWDGSVDSSFNSGNAISVGLSLDGEGHFLARAADGGYIVGGMSGNDVVAKKYSSSGDLVTDFGSSGTATVFQSGADIRYSDFRQDGQGGLVFFFGDFGSYWPIGRVGRLTADGQIDTSFGDNGINVLRNWDVDGGQYGAMALTPEGGILVVAQEVEVYGLQFVKYLPSEITVNNVAPEFGGYGIWDELSCAEEYYEGRELGLGFDFSDPGIFDTHTVWVDWGEGAGYEAVDNFSQYQGGGMAETFNTYADSGTYEIQIKIEDSDGDISTSTLSPIEVQDIAPEIYAAGSASVDEGGVYTLQLSVIDPGDDPVAQWDIDWGDGSASTGAAADWGSDITANLDGTWTATHTYADGDNAYTIQAVATTDEGAYAAVLTDASFGNIGQPFSQPAIWDELRYLSVQSDGKIVVIEWDVLYRMNADGSLDTTFGVNGALTLTRSGSAGTVRGIHILSDDSILLVTTGNTVSSVRYDYGLYWLDADGSPITTFGSNGELYGDFGTGTGSVYQSTLNGDTLLIGGRYDYDFALTAIDLTTGQVDTTFGSNGLLIVDHGGNETVMDMIFEDGVSVTFSGSGYLARYLWDGSVDSTFNSGNPFVSTGLSMQGCVRNLVQTADGGYVVVGEVSHDVIAKKYDAGGALDTSFGASGATTVFDGIHSVEHAGFLQDEDGNLNFLVGGWDIRNEPEGHLVRLTSDGQLDMSFGNDGIDRLGSWYVDDYYCGGMALTPDGGVLIGANDYYDWHPSFIKYLPSQITVNNVAPVVDFYDIMDSLTYECEPLVEGREVLLYFRFSDPGVSDTHTVWVDWGDGAGYEYIRQGQGYRSFDATHTFADNGTYTINVKITDGDGELISPIEVEIQNVMPEVYAAGSASVDEGSVYTLQLSATNDTGDDTITQWDIDWGDGATSTGTSADWGPDITLNLDGTWTATHTYVDGDNAYTITASVTDEDGTYGAVQTDVNFGDNGIHTSLSEIDIWDMNGLGVQSNGKVIILETPNLYRLNTDGTADTTFGSGGSVEISRQHGSDGNFKQLLILPGDSILLITSTNRVDSVTHDFGIFYLDSEGQPVSGFGADGELYGDFGSGTAYVTQSALDGNTLMIGGYSDNNYALAAIDLTTGQLDTTFGTNGVLTVDMGGTEKITGVVFQEDVSVTFSGSGRVLRYLWNGDADTTFNTTGFVVTGAMNMNSCVGNLIQTAAGETLVSGVAGGQAIVEKYTNLGLLDTAFGDNGRKLIAGSNMYFSTASLLQDEWGRIFIHGTGAESTMMCVLTSAGELDATFGNGGIDVLPQTYPIRQGAVLTPEGSVLLSALDSVSWTPRLIKYLPSEITVNNVAPVVTTNEGANVDEGGTVVITTAMLQTTDVADAADELIYTLTALPEHGALELYNGSTWVELDLTTNNTFTQADIDAGNLRYVHDGGEMTADDIADLPSLIYRSGFEGSLPLNDWTITTEGDSSVTCDTEAAKFGDCGLHIVKVDGYAGSAKINLSPEADPSCSGFWMKFIGSGEKEIFIGNGVFVYSGLNYLRVFYQLSGVAQNFIVNMPDRSQWNHIMLDVRPNEYIKVYVNGELGGEVTGSDVDVYTSAALDVICFGRTYYTTGYEMYIDEVRVGDTMADVLSPDSFNFTVSDGNVTLNETNFAITVNPVNDAPVISNQSFNALETATTIGTIIASDPDLSDALTYSITGGNTEGIFEINSTTGELTVAPGESMDYQTATYHDLTVSVTDGLLSDSATITVNVLED